MSKPKPSKRELDLLAQARKNLRRYGELSPALIVEGERSGVVGFKNFGPGEIGRRMLREAGRTVAGHKPWRASLIVDTWIKTEPGNLADYRPGDLARDPEATEGLVLASETHYGLRRVVFQRYEVEADKYTFDEPQVWDDDKVGQHSIISEFWTGVGQGAQGLT